MLAMSISNVTLHRSEILEGKPVRSIVGSFTTFTNISSTTVAAPPSAYDYELVEGFGDWDNDHFYIDDDDYRLTAYNAFNYLIKPQRSVRVRVTNKEDTDEWFEKTFTVDIINKSMTVDTILYGDPNDVTSMAKNQVCPEADTTVSYVSAFRDDCVIPYEHEIGAGLSYL